jgi:hypothetical protein
MTQPCVHLKPGSKGQWRTLGGILARVCDACARELDSRTTEVQRPSTPIEQYAVKEELKMSKGCTYEIRKAPQAFCGKACDPGEKMCPRHKFLYAHEQQLANEKQLAKEKERRAEVLAKHTKGRAA